MCSLRCFFALVIFVVISHHNQLSSVVANKLRLEEFKQTRAQLVGSKFSQLCTTQEGTGPFHYKWTKNKHQLSSAGANYQVKSTEDGSLLIINQLAATDAGNYSCTVTNSAGQSDQQTTMLTVKGFQF